MTQPAYVALKPLRFGTQALQPGDPVPMEAGRNYVQMLRLGQIAEISRGAGLAFALAAPFPEDSAVIFVGEDGAHALATFHLLQDAPEDVRGDLELPPGAQVALVTFADDQESTFVLPDSLLPEQPTRRLIEDLSRAAEEPAVLPEPFPLGSTILWVTADGAHHVVTFEGLTLPPEPDGEPVVILARVRNELLGEQYAPLLDLLAGDAAQRLLAFERRMGEEGALERQQPDPMPDEAQTRLAFLELLVKAIRTPGDAIPDDFPAAEFLRQNSVITLPGLHLLADGEQGKANLMALDAIGGGRADRILAALVSPPTPEG